MPKKKLSDMVFHRVEPPDFKDEVTVDDLASVIVRRLGLQRKKSRANHGKLLVELINFKKNETPITIEKIASILGVSPSQSYEEVRKWRSMGLLEFSRSQAGFTQVKGYMLTGNTVNRLLDYVESSLKQFIRETRRIAKDFDDSVILEFARSEKKLQNEIKQELKQEKEQKTEVKDESVDYDKITKELKEEQKKLANGE